MIQITVDTRQAVVTEKELLTSGSNGIEVLFDLSEDWDGLIKTATFRCDDDDSSQIDIAITDTNRCVIPWETLVDPERVLFAGIYGTDGDNNVIIPTIWVSLGAIRIGVKPGNAEGSDPTPDMWAQIQYIAETAGAANAEAAHQSEVAAFASQMNAANSAAQAANSAAASSASATQSGNSAGAALNSANTAAAKATEAAASATAAANASTAATGAKNAAQTAKAGAETAANNASSFASNAQNSAATATTRAQEAASSANSAATSASTASTKASQASTSATNAANSATAAAGSATTASTKAGEAATSATNAANSATAAAASETAAEAAQEAAETAQAAAEAVLESIPEDYTELTEAVAYNRFCIADDSIPYATNGTFSTNAVTMTEYNNLLTLDGTSYATSSQAFTKVQVSGIARWWNAATVPDNAKVYPVNLKQGHIYKLTASVKSGTRDAGTGSGNLHIRLIDSTETELASTTIGISDTSAEFEYTSNGESVTIRLFWARNMACTNLVVEILLRDITNESKIADNTADITENTSDIAANTANISENTSDIAAIKGTLYATRESILTAYTSGEFWNSQTDTAVVGTSSAYYRFAPISVTPGDKIHSKVFTGGSSKQNAILVVKSDYSILERYTGTRNAINTFDFTVPENAAYLLITSQGSERVTVTVCEKETVKNPTLTSFYGAKMSLLGDSFSAIKGFSTGGHYYYPHEGTNVQVAAQLWWNIVANELGMTPLVVGAWTGSCVASGIREATSSNSYRPASDPSRCEALGDGANNPDVVFIAMGLNDYSYSDDASEFGTWDGTTALGTNADLSDYDTSSFRTAYATMIARIQHKYPNAYIICLTPWYSQRKTTDTGATYLNAIGKTITDYAKAVEEISAIMHCQVINVTDIGFNRYNYYPTYASDSPTIPTHPNIAGHKVIANAILAQMKSLNRIGG